MTMRIVFLQSHNEWKEGDDVFVPRQKARRYCEDGKAVPYKTWAVMEENRKEEEQLKKREKKPEPEEKPEPVKKPAPPKRKYKKREKAVTVDDSATDEE
jgi:hypothetical protein